MTAAYPERGLSPSQRILKRKEFQEVYRAGRRVVCPYFVAFLQERVDGPLRLGVVASRKVGGAVRRNRAKRLLREAFRRNRPNRQVSADLLLVARRAILGVGLAEVEASFSRAIGRVFEKSS